MKKTARPLLLTLHNDSDGFERRSPDATIVSVCRQRSILNLFRTGDTDENSVTISASSRVSVVQVHYRLLLLRNGASRHLLHERLGPVDGGKPLQHAPHVHRDGSHPAGKKEHVAGRTLHVAVHDNSHELQ